MEAGGETPTLYTVLPEKTSAVGGAMMGSSHVYDLGSTVSGNIRKVWGYRAKSIVQKTLIINFFPTSLKATFNFDVHAQTIKD